MNLKFYHPKEKDATVLTALLQAGLNYHQQGKLDLAEKNYKEILDVTPQNADALHLLGVLSNQKQDNQTAIDLIVRAIQILPHQPIYHNNLGNAYRDSGMSQQAIGCYQKALQVKPDLAEAYINMGIAYHQISDFAAATAAYQKAIQIRPDSCEAYFNLGNAYKDQGFYDDAIACYERVVAITPMFIEAYYNMANVLEQQGRYDEAIHMLTQCLQINPDWAEVHNNLGNLLKHKGLSGEAIIYFQKAIQIKPHLVEAHNNLGNALRDQGGLAEAIVCYQKALQHHPEYGEAHLNLGITLVDHKRLNEAIDCFQKAIQLNPRLAEAYNYMGLALADQGKRDEAIDCFQEAIKMNPHYAEAFSYLIHQLQCICDWPSLKIYSARLDELYCQTSEESSVFVEPPFIHMARNSDIDQHLRVAKQWCRKITQPLQNLKRPFPFDSRRQPKRKLVIGYLSGDFHDHATAHLMRSVFGLHNRRKFEIYGYSYGPDDNSEYRNHIIQECDQFIDIREQSFFDAARRIHADNVDILVDLKGHTQGARLGILACRPAPIQAHYLGYPGTTGADFMDYMITDKIVTPEEHAPFYTEKLVYLPGCYQVNDHQQEIASQSWSRAALGLPDKGFVFCSFNLPYKIDPLLFDCWMRILNQVPHSVFWLFNGGESTTQNLRQEARRRGIDPFRLVFADKQPKAQHLARLQMADLALDTRLVNGHTTTSDSLWASVPVMTLQGGHFASRVSASLLNAIGLPELIVDHLDAYEALAVRLANDPAGLRKIRNKLSQNRFKQPLFDTPRFVRNLEQAYDKMWQIFMEGLVPRPFEVIED